MIWAGLGHLPGHDEPPTIIIESVSKGKVNLERDYVVKRAEYKEIGVKEYWIIDRFAKTMTVCTFGQDGDKDRVIDANQTYETPLLPGYTLPLPRLLSWQHGGPEIRVDLRSLGPMSGTLAFPPPMVQALYIGSISSQPLVGVDQVVAVAGHGLEGDRKFRREGMPAEGRSRPRADAHRGRGRRGGEPGLRDRARGHRNQAKRDHAGDCPQSPGRQAVPHRCRTA